ncbi:MAG: hypothetical protein DMD37_04805 [Gemmatimonadetes bacterium]|nr:MAG: hypothetical protein DMD74_06675 [Gemmatimonadota bacterium]PYO85559.1 MAG: hypothetical protein DMD68_03370 [Gemmatimonadota bacterium]PYP63829.1 MAG: hypothetical protein DMD37_04805 [Gemmatimonadota bacterium]
MGPHAVPLRAVGVVAALAVPRSGAVSRGARADHDAGVATDGADGARATGRHRVPRHRRLGGRADAGRAALCRRRAGAAPQIRRGHRPHRVGRRPEPQGDRRLRRPGCRNEKPARGLCRPRARLGECMSISREEVLHIARLAELDVVEEALPTLVEQMSRILDYVAQLNRLPTGETARPYVAGPDAIALRADEVKPWPLAFGPKQLAPAFRDGFFVVPRLEAFDDGGAA